MLILIILNDWKAHAKLNAIEITEEDNKGIMNENATANEALQQELNDAMSKECYKINYESKNSTLFTYSTWTAINNLIGWKIHEIEDL